MALDGAVASQPEILRYIEHVADRFDLRRDIQLDTQVTAVWFDKAANRWHIETNRGDHVSARFCIMATGCLSSAKIPAFAGLDFDDAGVWRDGAQDEVAGGGEWGGEDWFWKWCS